MPVTAPPTIEDALQQLRKKFHEGSQEHACLWHFLVQAPGYVRRSVLEWFAQGREAALIDVIKTTNDDGSVVCSCFSGNAQLLGDFRILAAKARLLFVLSLEHIGITPDYTNFTLHQAWMADMYNKAAKEPTPLLNVKSVWFDKWVLPILNTAEQSTERQTTHTSRTRPPQAKLESSAGIYYYRTMIKDVFVSSTAMIDWIFRMSRSDQTFRDALKEPAPCSSSTANLQVGLPPVLPIRHNSNSRPDWVKETELIGPCGLKAFAKLMGIGERQLYRLIKEGPIWKEPGPSSKRFFFCHRDTAMHRKLREDFETMRQKR